MTKHELVVQATKEIIVATVTTKKITRAELLSLIKDVSNAIGEAYDNC